MPNIEDIMDFPHPKSGLLDIKEAEVVTGISAPAWKQRIHSGEIIAIKLSDDKRGKLYIPIKELKRYLESKILVVDHE